MKMTSKGFKPRLQYVQLNTGNFVVRDNATGKLHLITDLRLQRNLKFLARMKEKQKLEEKEKIPEMSYAYRVLTGTGKEHKEHPEFTEKQARQIAIDHLRENPKYYD